MEEALQLFEMESDRLRFRRLRADDFSLIAPILQDAETMYAWEHGFSHEEVIDWIADMLRRYHEDHCGYFAALSRETGELVALAGPLVERLYADETAIGLGYIVRRDLWKQGYGTECAQACIRYAFDKLDTRRVIASIRPDNLASLRVAAKCDMKPVGQLNKAYQGKQIPHIICAIDQPEPKKAVPSPTADTAPSAAEQPTK